MNPTFFISCRLLAISVCQIRLLTVGFCPRVIDIISMLYSMSLPVCLHWLLVCVVMAADVVRMDAGNTGQLFRRVGHGAMSCWKTKSCRRFQCTVVLSVFVNLHNKLR